MSFLGSARNEPFFSSSASQREEKVQTPEKERNKERPGYDVTDVSPLRANAAFPSQALHKSHVKQNEHEREKGETIYAKVFCFSAEIKRLKAVWRSVLIYGTVQYLSG